MISYFVDCFSFPTVWKHYQSNNCKTHVTIDKFYSNRNGKAKNRPSFRQILMHIDIAATDILTMPDQKYFGKQVSNLSLILL